MQNASVRIGLFSALLCVVLGLVACDLDRGLSSTDIEAVVEARVESTVEAMQHSTSPSISAASTPDIEAIVEAKVREALQTSDLPDTLATHDSEALFEDAFLEGLLAGMTDGLSSEIAEREEWRANAGEIASVQAALDAMMSHLELWTVTVITQANATNNMGTFPDATYRLNGGSTGDYMRQATTKCSYYVSSSGVVSQTEC